MSWTVPAPSETCDVRVDDDTTIIVRRHGNPEGPRVLLSHGNGMAADLYYPFWSLLEADFDIFVHDLRNHGWNSVGDIGAHTIHHFVDDGREVVRTIGERFGDKPVAGVFHSISAVTASLQAMDSDDFSCLVLFDPPFAKSGVTDAKFDVFVSRMVAGIRRREVRFQSREDFAELLSFSPAYSRAVPGIADLLARTTLRPSADGSGYELRCPPEFEAQVMEYLWAWAALVDLGALTCPTKVIGADPTLPFSYMPTFDLSEIIEVDYDFIPESAHLLQLECPEPCVETMLDFLVEQGHVKGRERP